MIIVQETFICKPGNASKMAKMMKEWMTVDPDVKYVLTDMVGQYHRVITLSQYENLSAYEKSFEKMMNPTPEMKKEMEKYSNMNEMYVSGGREIFKVW